ncbi:MAG: hypothetical protein ACE3L7_05110 [Candidatus Pristimantibacillus sp.]
MVVERLVELGKAVRPPEQVTGGGKSFFLQKLLSEFFSHYDKDSAYEKFEVQITSF